MQGQCNLPWLKRKSPADKPAIQILTPGANAHCRHGLKQLIAPAPLELFIYCPQLGPVSARIRLVFDHLAEYLGGVLVQSSHTR